MPYQLGETFDLARAYAASEDIKGAQQNSVLRDLQIQGARKELAKPEEISYEQAIGHARLAHGAAASVAADPSDANVRKQYEGLKRSNSLTSDFDLASVLAMPPEQRAAAANKWVNEIGTYLATADPQKAANPGYGTPQAGLHDGQPEQFVVDDSGTVKWLGIPPVPGASGAGPADYGTFIYGDEGVFYGNNRTGVIGPAPGGSGIRRTTDDPSVQREVEAAKAGGTVEGKTATETALSLPDRITTAERSVQQVQDLLVHPGFHAYVGATIRPGARFIEGSAPADFQARIEQVQAGAFLEGLKHLQGMGALSNKEGATATAAITRMQKAVSEKEFITAANAYIDTINKGVANARKLAARAPGAGGTPNASANRQQVAPPAAIQYLQAHPEFQAEFQAKYGYLP